MERIERKVHIELQTFPCIATLSMVNEADLVVLESRENYNKRSFRNKFIVVSSNGPCTMSIPLTKGKHDAQPIRETLISYDEDWPTRMWRSIQSFYGKSPFFEFYSHELRSLIHSGESNLFDFNWKAFEWMYRTLKLSTPLSMSTEYHRNISDSIDMRDRLSPRSIIHHEKYPQVFERQLGFQHNVSGIDLIFAFGPESRSFLNRNTLKSLLQDASNH